MGLPDKVQECLREKKYMVTVYGGKSGIAMRISQSYNKNHGELAYVRYDFGSHDVEFVQIPNSLSLDSAIVDYLTGKISELPSYSSLAKATSLFEIFINLQRASRQT